MATTISVPTLFDRLHQGPPTAVLDVRSAAEFAIGHIPGAVNIPMEQIENRMADIPAALWYWCAKPASEPRSLLAGSATSPT